jgi:polyisoprenoid-binding protein YceI
LKKTTINKTGEHKMQKLNIFLFILLAVISTLNAQTTFVASADSRNQATFESNAPLEDIVGVSNEIEAVATIDLANLANSKGKVTVDLSHIKTGIDLRDEHLRSDTWLNTDKYPHAVFVLNKISGASELSDGKKENVKLHGSFTVHGVTRDIVANGEITYFKESDRTKNRIAGNLLKVNADFEIKLSDYEIEIPGMVVGKVDEVIKVSTNFVGTDSGSKMTCGPCGEGKCNPCGAKGKCNPCGV